MPPRLASIFSVESVSGAEQGEAGALELGVHTIRVSDDVEQSVFQTTDLNSATLDGQVVPPQLAEHRANAALLLHQLGYVDISSGFDFLRGASMMLTPAFSINHCGLERWTPRLQADGATTEKHVPDHSARSFGPWASRLSQRAVDWIQSSGALFFFYFEKWF